MYNSYHNHTPLCHHAFGKEESYVLKAIEGGYRVFGFADHAPHLFRDLIHASRMTPDELKLYVSTVSELREKYKSEIDIRIGLELEYYPKTHESEVRFFREAGVEYFILGQHMTGDGCTCGFNSFAETSEKDHYTAYVDQCLEGLASGVYSYIAHPDVFYYSGDDDFYKKESDRLIAGAVSLGIPLELNLLGLSGGRHYPNPLFWERVSGSGAKVILGADAHSPERVYSREEIKAAEGFAKKYRLELIESIELK